MPTLSDIFAGVQVTPEQGAAVLQGLVKDVRDSDPELADKINGAVNALLYAPDPQATKEAHTETRAENRHGRSE